MTLFQQWSECEKHTIDSSKKRLYLFTELKGGREKILPDLSEIIRSHYVEQEKISSWVKKFGFPKTSDTLREVLPKNIKIRSGDLGEILATELLNEKSNMKVLVKRLRYKTGPEASLQGEDFIAINQDKLSSRLNLLKGEAKSGINISTTVVCKARCALNKDGGSCSSKSLLFIADILLKSDSISMNKLGEKIEKLVLEKKSSESTIIHMLFTLSGNCPQKVLRLYLDEASDERKHIVVNFQINGHKEFVELIYEEAIKIGKT